MIRTQIYLSERQREKLAALADAQGAKLSELIREAIDQFLYSSSEGHRTQLLKQAEGIWHDHLDLPTPVDLRKSWDR